MPILPMSLHDLQSRRTAVPGLESASPDLQTHEYHSLPRPFEENGKVLEAYAQHQTPGAYRVFWCYGPQRDQITINAITPRP